MTCQDLKRFKGDIKSALSCQYCRKHTNALQGEGRILTLEELKQLGYRKEVYITAQCGCFLRVKINGQPKLWKRSPGRVQIPYKYGLYEYGYITEHDKVKVES